MDNLFKNFTSSETYSIHGSTTISHRIRVKLDVTNDEFTLLDMIHRIQATDKLLTTKRAYRWIGMKAKDIKPTLQSLVRKDLVEQIEKGKFKVTKRYQEILNMKVDDDFEFFWAKIDDRRWPGSKQSAKLLFRKLLSKFSAEYLIEQKKAYFEFLDMAENDFRNTMQATTFLSIKDQRFAEPWKEYIEDILKKRKGSDKTPIDRKRMSKEEKEEYFG